MDRAIAVTSYSSMVAEQDHGNSVILNCKLVTAFISSYFHSQANRTITKLRYFFNHKLPYSWEKLHQISIHTQINLGEVKAK